MKINLYSEDGYSAWVLLKRFPSLLLALGDLTPPEAMNIVVFYRPSFGRASDSPTGISKQFGEFDIVIGTPHGVYLIESKPEKCGELNSRTLVMTLREEQVRRHRIFRTYRALWQKYRPSNWTNFRETAMNEFVAAHPGWTMAEKRDLLSRNLEFVLRSLQDCGEAVRDTVLLFHKPGQEVVFTNVQEFACVAMPLEMVAGSEFVCVDGSEIIASLGSDLESSTRDNKAVQ
jgi:hypothetical protein